MAIGNSLKIYKMEKIIRKKGNTNFVAVDTLHREVLGSKIADVFWIECDLEGNISDGNNDGVLKTELIICKVPEGRVSLDISTLSEDCLNNL